MAAVGFVDVCVSLHSSPNAASYKLLMKQGWEPELLHKIAFCFSSLGVP